MLHKNVSISNVLHLYRETKRFKEIDSLIIFKIYFE